MNFFLKRVLQLVTILIVTTFFSILLVSFIPGDTAQAICGTAGKECVEQKRQEFHLDDSVPLRYAKWLGSAVRGDLGTDNNKQSVAEKIGRALPNTIALIVYSQILSLGLALPAAVYAAKRSDRIFDRWSSATAFFLLAVPAYALAIPLRAVFGVRFSTGVFDVLAFLPAAIALACTDFAIYLRLLRSDLIATLQEDYITMAKAKGLSSRRILWRHAFRPSSFTLLTSAGLNFGRLIGGTLIVEVIFTLPGIGLLMFQSLTNRDIATMLGGLVVIVTGFVLVLFLVDMLYGILDPRIRHARALT